MRKSIIAVALLSSFSASAADVRNHCVAPFDSTACTKQLQTDLVALEGEVATLSSAVTLNNGVEGRVTELEKGHQGLVTSINEVKGVALDALGTAVNASESAANAIQGVADTNTRVDEVKASVSVVGAQVERAQNTADLAVDLASAATAKADYAQETADTAVTSATKAQTAANRAEAKADMNTTSIVKEGERVDLVEQDVSATNHRIDSNEAAFNQWAAQSTARADEIASGVAHNSGRLDKAEKDIAGLKTDVKNLDDKIGRVGSMAMAVGSLHYDGLTTGGAVAVGTYDGKAAIAAGAQFNVSERSAANIQLAYDGKAVGAGAGYQFRW